MITDPDYMRLSSQPWYLRWPTGLAAIWVGVSLYMSMSVPAGPVSHASFILALVVLIVVLIAQELLRPKPEFEDARPAGNGDFQFVTATEGRVQPLIWGRTILLAPNCVWYGDIDALPIHESVRTGWFSKEEFISGYEYHMGVQFGLCRGPDVELIRVWLGREQKWLVYDSDVSGIISTESHFDIDEPELHFPAEGGVQSTVDFYPGNDNQTKNEYLNDSARQLVSPMVTIPAYNGVCGLVAREMTSGTAVPSDKGAYIGNSTAVDSWSVELQRFPPIFSGQSAGEHKVPASSGLDCNPMNVIYEILTNLEWGLGFLAGEIDIGPGSSFLAAADTLAIEVNGWSMVLDKQIPATELLGEVERQVDGIVFLAQDTGTWQIKLARNDYTIGSLLLLDETNSEFKDYQRATWEDTTNQLTVKFNRRSDEYKESYAVAQDEANIIMQGAGSIDTGRVVSGSISYPGCKLSSLASQLVWRSLRTMAYPLARCTFMVNREFWNLKPGDVFKWTNESLSIDELPMRVAAIDFGTLTKNKITITAVQDIFEFLDPSFGDPPDTDWIPPIGTVINYPIDERIAFEMPRAMLVRHPDYVDYAMPYFGASATDFGPDQHARIMCAAKRQGPETRVNIVERHHATTPSGNYSPAGKVTAFMEIGTLKANLGLASSQPTAAITIEPAASSQAALAAGIVGVTAETLGSELNNIALIGDEFILFRGGAVNGADIDLTNVYRGAFDTVQATHSLGDKVYIISAGASQMDVLISRFDDVDLKFLPQSFSSTLAEGSATVLAIKLALRAPRPLAPSVIQYNGAGVNYGTPDLEGEGSTFDDFGVSVEWWKRTHTHVDEVANQLSDIPTSNEDTDYQVEIRHTPYSVSDVVVTSAWSGGDESGTDASIGDILRNTILANSPNTAVQNLEFRIRSRHSIYTGFNNDPSRYETTHIVTPDSSLTGQVAMGQMEWSNEFPTTYAAVNTSTHNVTIASSFATGNIEYKLNSGSWINVITAGGTTGGFAVSSSDVIHLRHTASDGSQLKFVELDDAGTPVAYGIMLS